jgi:hypothetical protein
VLLVVTVTVLEAMARVPEEVGRIDVLLLVSLRVRLVLSRARPR